MNANNEENEGCVRGRYYHPDSDTISSLRPSTLLHSISEDLRLRLTFTLSFPSLKEHKSITYGQTDTANNFMTVKGCGQPFIGDGTRGLTSGWGQRGPVGEGRHVVDFPIKDCVGPRPSRTNPWSRSEANVCLVSQDLH